MTTSSTNPRAKYPCSGSPEGFSNGRTAMVAATSTEDQAGRGGASGWPALSRARFCNPSYAAYL